jgi:hypothetical protein
VLAGQVGGEVAAAADAQIDLQGAKKALQHCSAGALWCRWAGRGSQLQARRNFEPPSRSERPTRWQRRENAAADDGRQGRGRHPQPTALQHCVRESVFVPVEYTQQT